MACQSTSGLDKKINSGLWCRGSTSRWGRFSPGSIPGSPKKSMKKLLIVIMATAAVVMAYWLTSPLFITKRVDEKLESVARTSEVQVIAQGIFAGLAGHNGEGTAKLLKIGEKYYIRLEDDFRVTNGPDLFVYFGKDGQYAASARLGALKGNEGGQNYEVPAEIDPSQYNEVWVWCRAFSVPFAKAILK